MTQRCKNVTSVKLATIHQKIRNVMCIPEASTYYCVKVTVLIRSLRLKVIQSVCYSTEFSEDDEVLSEASLMLDTEGVDPYLFKPERSSSESHEETLDITDSYEKQIGNTYWYYKGSFCTALIQNVFLQVHLQSLPVDANCLRVHLLSRT